MIQIIVSIERCEFEIHEEILFWGQPGPTSTVLGGNGGDKQILIIELYNFDKRERDCP